MISRWKSPALARNIASSAVLSPKVLARAHEDKGKEEPSEDPKRKPSDDPWAPVFEDIASSAPPAPSPRSHLHPRFFTSRPGPKTFFSSNTSRRGAPSGSGKRAYGTDARGRAGSAAKSPSDSNSPSAWDHVFEDIDSNPVTTPAWQRAAASKFPTTSPRRPQRRQAMTAREISAFDDMFDMIFTAVGKSREPGTQGSEQAQPEQAGREAGSNPVAPAAPASASASTSAPEPATSPTIEATPPPSPQPIGPAPPGETLDLFGKLRRQSNRMRRTTATDELLDRKKEEMQLCDTDQELLDWSLREVFSSPELANPTYPHVLAHLMYTFRTKYRDPHTALALFTQAKRRSIHSYVFGCTTPAYNELLEARWALDGTLKSVEDALAEMKTNGVSTDKRTAAFVERVRREVGERLVRSGEESGVWDALARVEGYVKRRGPAGGDRGRDSRLDAKKRHWNEEWKTAHKEDFQLGEDRLSLRA